MPSSLSNSGYRWDETYEVFVGSIGAFSFTCKGGKKTLVAVSVALGIVEETSQLGANEVTAGQNLRSFIACGRSGNFMSFICCGIFIFLTAETARAGAAVIPASCFSNLF